MAKGSSKPRRKVARRTYLAPDKMRAAWLAGNGKGLTEIAALVGGTTRVRVHTMLRSYGLGTVPKISNEVAMMVILRRQDLDAFHDEAAERDADPALLAAHLLTILIREPVLLTNLLDELEEGEAQRP
ncbi:MAG: hypothetical protein U1E62_21585 [Alsobacter sp.]